MIADLIQKSVHQELIKQIKGLINIEVGNYLYRNKGKLNLDLYIDGNDGIDVYIYDKDFAKITKDNQFYFKEYFETNNGLMIDDKSMLGHYHSDDLLYLLMNFKEEKKNMRKNVDEYISWKEQYLNEKNKK